MPPQSFRAAIHNPVCVLLLVFALVHLPALAHAVYASSVSGVTVTMNGNSASDNLSITQSGGLLKHNRKTAGDPNFVSDFDFASNVGGEQTITTSPSIIFAINGGGGLDSLNVNDTANNIATNYTITSTTINGRYFINYQQLAGVIVQTGNGNEQDNIRSTATGTEYTILAMGTGGKSITASSASHKLDDIQGTLNVVGNGEATIRLDDSLQSNGFTYTVAEDSSDTRIDRAQVASIFCQNASVTLVAGAGNDTFFVQGDQTPVTISAGNGADTCTVSNVAHRVELAETLTFSGSNGTDNLIIDDSAFEYPSVFEYDSLLLTCRSTNHIEMNTVDNVTVLGGTSHNYAQMYMSNATFTPAFFWNLGQSGKNNILEVNAAGNTTEALDINGASRNITATFDTGGNFSPVSWDHADLLLVNCLEGRDLVTASPSAVTDMIINGDDPATAPGDTLTLNSLGAPFSLTGDTFLADGFQPIEFSGFESVATPALPHAPDFIGFFGIPVIKCKTSSSGVTCSIKGSFAEINIGDQPDGGSVTQFFLSNDNVLDGADTALNSAAVKGLQPGAFKAVKVSAKLPAGVDPGGKFLIAKLDANGSVAELRESNNIAVIGPIVH